MYTTIAFSNTLNSKIRNLRSNEWKCILCNTALTCRLKWFSEELLVTVAVTKLTYSCFHIGSGPFPGRSWSFCESMESS